MPEIPMILAPLLALALFAQEAAPQVSEPAAVGAATAASVEGPVPPGAPSDDYGLVSWCQGALTGHMALHAQVKPELDRLSTDPQRDELDAQQMAAGREYVALYGRAVAAAETANPRLRGVGEAARRKGEGIWTPAANAIDPKTTMWSWLMWELPGRCETAALRLAETSALLAPVTDTAPAEAPAVDAPSTEETAPPPT